MYIKVSVNLIDQFDQTILLILSQLCIETNLEFEIIKKATNCATMFILRTRCGHVVRDFESEAKTK